MTVRLRAFWGALRSFLEGFTGMPAARLPDGCCTRHALADRAARRKTCC
jgi:hypothetical protein